MNALVALVALVVAADLPQRLAVLRWWPARRRLLAGVIAALGVLALAAVADPILDALDISAPAMQIGGSMVLALWCIWCFFTWTDEPLPASADPPSARDAVVPAAFPFLLHAQLGVVVVAVAGRNGIAWPAVAALVVAATVAGAPSLRPLARRATRRTAATLGVVAAVAMMYDGVFAI